MKIYRPIALIGSLLAADTFAQRTTYTYSASGSFADSSQVNIAEASQTLTSQLSESNPMAAQLLGFTTEGADVLVATLPGFRKTCHVHGSDARLRLVSWSFYFQTGSFKEQVVLEPGDEFLVPNGTPHIEGTVGKIPSVLITAWNPLSSDLVDNSIDVAGILCEPESEDYTVPESWTATALAHPFAPTPQTGPDVP